MNTPYSASILAFAAVTCLTPLLCAAQSPGPARTATELVQLAKANSPELQKGIEDTYPAKAIELGRVWSGHLHDYFFTVRAASRPVLLIDDAPGPAIQPIPSTNLWFAAAQIEQLGRLHSFRYQIDGKDFGGTVNMPAFTELSYPMAGVKQGTLSPQLTLTSQIYDGMKSDYWIYATAGYDPAVPAALMVFQDGGGFIERDDTSHSLDTIDNLVALKKIPPMVCVFISPGKIDGPPGNPTYEFVKAYGEKWKRTLDDSMRSTLYDTVNDRYARMLRDELLPAVAAKYNLRKDGYSHAISGLSSGGICSFNTAWQMPELFSRVLSGIGSFTSIQWQEAPGVTAGGQDYPEKVLRDPHRNIRVWLQDGSDDMEWNQYGSWPMANIRMANALKLKEYDFHFSFGKGGHGREHYEAELPRELTWLWRDYDPAKTGQTFEIEPAEKAKPVFRVTVFNRDAD